MIRLPIRDYTATCVSLRLAVAFVVAGMTAIPRSAIAQQLPLADGVYLSSESQCQDLRNNDLDFVEFEVTKGGRAFGLPEASCVVASVKNVREGRYSVTADCDEFGELWEYSFFLDVTSDEEIAIDGATHRRCELDPSVLPPTAMSLSAESAALIEEWETENEGCRGGSGDDPGTFKACDRRDATARRLDDLGLCYGREADVGRADYEWHECAPGSIRWAE